MKEEITKSKVANIWGREIKLFNELYEIYPDDQFWKGLSLKFKLNSLAFFKTSDGLEELKSAWNLFKLPQNKQQESISIDEIKHGDDLILDQKNPSNISDFLK